MTIKVNVHMKSLVSHPVDHVMVVNNNHVVVRCDLTSSNENFFNYFHNISDEPVTLACEAINTLFTMKDFVTDEIKVYNGNDVNETIQDVDNVHNNRVRQIH